jgi:Y-X(10)_GDL-associated radical SAM protein
MYCAIQTGGRNLTPERMQQAVDAGLNGVGVSLDGLANLHDRLRNVPGSFDRALDTLRRANKLGLAISVNTQIGAETMADLPALMDAIIAVGAKQWQIQLTVAMGNAVDNDHLLLQPYQLLELMPILAQLHREGLKRGLLMIPGNNIGYFGPYERVWRGLGDERLHWSGCSAGQTSLALEADGTVKGCPSLATVGFAGGNVRDLSLGEIWRTSDAIHFGRMRSTDDLWGFCGTCYYADVCRGGCTWTSHSLLGVPGNNPYCHHRAITLDKQGMRERVVKVRDADRTSFAVGEFELITETVADGTVVRSSTVDRQNWQAPPPGSASDEGRVVPRLILCRGCELYIDAHETICPHCSTDVAVAGSRHAEDQARRERLINEVSEHLASLRHGYTD